MHKRDSESCFLARLIATAVRIFAARLAIATAMPHPARNACLRCYVGEAR